MLRRLFRGRNPLGHPDPAVRRAAVNELDAAAAADAAADLARLVRDDPDPDVRLACLVRVSDRVLLESVLDDPKLGRAAAERLRALTPGPEDPSASIVDELLRLPSQEAAARLGAMDDVDALLTLVLKSRGELREQALAHPRLASAAALTRLEKQSRHKDKSVNRHARQHLDRFRRIAAQADGRRARAEELSAALARTPPATHDRAWRERQHQLHERLEGVLDDYRALRAELAAFGHDVPDLESLRTDRQTLPALEEPPPVAPAESADPPTAEDGGVTDAGSGGDVDPFEALVQGFHELNDALTSGRPFADIARQRQALTDQWLTIADHTPPGESQHQVFESVSHRFRELADAMERLGAADAPALPAEPLDETPPKDAAGHRAFWEAVSERRRALKRLEQIRRQVRWPSWAPATAEYGNLLQAAETLQSVLARADSLLDGELAALEEQVTALATAIEDGSLNSAQSLLARARSLHDALPPAAVRAVGKRLGKQAARLAELKDWQTFATSPKRESLVEAMETLAASPLEPRLQADRIKDLRRQWQALGPVTQAADGRLADRFNVAAETAFEPCRAHFAEQAEVRKANLAERQRICTQLEQYLEQTDWGHADMKAAEKIMRAARDEWRRFHPVDRHPGKDVEARFEALQGQLHDRVKAEWDRNLGIKEAIVAEAEALLASDQPVQDKVNAAKRLQARWRDVGITPRRPDQRLWRAFRAACDDIFSARDHSRQAATAVLDELESTLAARLDAFERTLGTVDPAAVNEAELRAFRQETADVERLPQSRRPPLAARRGELADAYQTLLDSRRRTQRREALLALCRWDEAVSAAESARRHGENCELSGLPEPPEGAAKLMEARRAQAAGDVPTADARRLAVKAELAAGLASPPEDEPLRLEVQVERLQAGLTGGGDREDPYTLAEDWCRLGPKDDTLTPFRERVFSALTAMLS